MCRKKTRYEIGNTFANIRKDIRLDIAINYVCHWFISFVVVPFGNPKIGCITFDFIDFAGILSTFALKKRQDFV